MRILFALILLLSCLNAECRTFNEVFQDKTLRLDYTFSGNNRMQKVYLDELYVSDGWYGRRVNLNKLLLTGNGQITVTDTLGRDTLYRHSFSTLFQEWQTSEEATKVSKSFENVFLVPMPKFPVNVTLTLLDTHNQIRSTLTHRVDPNDILIRPIGKTGVTPWKYMKKGGDSKDCIDIAFVAEGYKESEMETFYKDCQMSIDALMAHHPFQVNEKCFNFVAVACPSEDSDVSIPHKGIWKNTALGSNYDTFYSERYLTTLHLKKLHDVLAGIPYEHIIILANTENYGGGGIYNSYVMSSAHHPTCKAVTVHEFGHSFGGLGDEYYYDDQYETMYPSDTEPWEPNLTTLVDFKSKWADMLDAGTQVPTPTDYNGATHERHQPRAENDPLYNKVGVYEGGGYQSKGVYRPTLECRMKINEAPVFCPVCDRAIQRLIKYYTEEQ